MNSGSQRKIVVGVDGSKSSKCALRWALKQAALSGASVQVVTAWEFPAFYSWEGGPMPPDDFEESARKSLDESVDEVEHDTVSITPVQRVLTHGHAAQALLDASADADLLVVGSRGHGSFYGALLGSVSQRCAQHAHCPVVIVRR
ncbi:universal stress protein [Saccharopolyspora phatthalungensis]|uniref:Nucleotide-binding universal stress UspA family protein n=1 Tax=Saccharopolyspora phatthalungensis TaxID=664693 RepID=A0A840Q798_9PSEU|nr:universal stress protein [Saccharopolyspora phatthalungensis]MBB5158382.1 nucleotide-binding universal stress UspA family protein [Saccharopolyspora phatthalungensis]